MTYSPNTRQSDLSKLQISPVFLIFRARHFNFNNIIFLNFQSIINHGFFANLGQKTILPLIITSKLWNGLENMTTQHHQRCVLLLYNLLNSLPVSEARVCSQEKQMCLSIEKVITR